MQVPGVVFQDFIKLDYTLLVPSPRSSISGRVFQTSNACRNPHLTSFWPRSGHSIFYSPKRCVA
jgi:hypothetical protein